MKTLLIAITATASLLAMNAQAGKSSQSELRGYNACVNAADPAFQGLSLSRTYYLAKEDNRNVYFLNGSAWLDGERVDVRISCDTSRNGRNLLSQTSNLGSFALQTGDTPIQIATQ